MAAPRSLLTLVRHGQTAWHAENRYAGISDIDLTETGRVQADALATWAVAHPPALLFTSPMRRALETIKPAEAALGVRATIVAEVREMHFGVAEGRTLDELAEDDPDMVQRFAYDPAVHPFPGAESAVDAAERGARALCEIAVRAAGRPALVVTHNTLLRLSLCSLLGIPVGNYRAVFPRLGNGALTQVLMPADGTRELSLLTLNVPLTAS